MQTAPPPTPPLSKCIQRRFNAYFSKPKQGTLELPLYSWALGPWSRLWHQENMFGKRNAQQAFTSRYLSSEVGWTRGRGWRGGVCSQAMSWQVERRQTWTCLRAQPCLLLPPPSNPWHNCGTDAEWDEAGSQVRPARHHTLSEQR